MAVLSAAPGIFAQDIAYVFPAGGKQGVTNLVLEVSGQNLMQVKEAVISGTGVRVKSTQWVELDMPTRNKRRQVSAQLGQIVRVTVDIAPDAEAGLRNLWILSTNNLSNPVPFYVGTRNEISEYEPNSRFRLAQVVTNLPVVINGQIEPKDRDYYVFKAKKGEQVVAQLIGRRLVPYIPDAVPGWFQPVLTLFATNNTTLCRSDNTLFDPDPTLEFQVPADGEYVLEVRDALYRGRYDFTYRLSLGALPLVSGFFPMGRQEGTKTVPLFNGLNLDGVDPEAADVLRYPDLKFVTGRLPEIATDTNCTVKLPVVVNGRILALGEEDNYTFEGKAGQKVVLDLVARKIGSPLNGMLALYDGSGKLVAKAGERSYSWVGFQTHEADPAQLIVRLPEDGLYTARVADMFDKYGSLYTYRLRISEPMPDFDLWAGTASFLIPKWGYTAVPVRCFRSDGCTNEVYLSVRGLPADCKVSGNWISTATNETTLLISGVPRGVVSNEFKGTFEIWGCFTNGATVVEHKAVSAVPREQAFAYTHWVPTRGSLYYLPTNTQWRTPGNVVGSEVSNGVQFVNGEAQITVQSWSFGKGRVADVVVLEPAGMVSVESFTAVSNKPGFCTVGLKLETNAPPVLPDKLILGFIPNVKFKENAKAVVKRKPEYLPALRLHPYNQTDEPPPPSTCF